MVLNNTVLSWFFFEEWFDKHYYSVTTKQYLISDIEIKFETACLDQFISVDFRAKLFHLLQR